MNDVERNDYDQMMIASIIDGVGKRQKMIENLIDAQVKPAFKYVGGKRWLREALRERVEAGLLTNDIDTYVEPFAGGLGSFLSVYDLLLSYRVEKVILADINPSLINFYSHVVTNHEALIEETLKLEDDFQSANKPESVFYAVRDLYNLAKKENSPAQSARFFFLLKHCFNGLYRENAKGYFNASFNKSHKTYHEAMREAVTGLQRVFSAFEIQFVCRDFSETDFSTEKTFFYIDPPYLNENTKEMSYTKSGFHRIRQFELIYRLQHSNYLYSNHASHVLEDALNKHQGTEIFKVFRKNLMSCKASARGEMREEMLVLRSATQRQIR